MRWTKDNSQAWAQDWIASWNSHSLDRIMTHYAPEVVLTSPVAQEITGSAEVHGQDALRAYFARGLEVYPDLQFTLIDIGVGVSSLVLYYENQKGSKTCEFMAFGDQGTVTQVIAHYTR